MNPCLPSPCGPYSQCKDINGSPACSCLSGYVGNPPNCRPECVINSDCANDKACIRESCINPCPGSCGINAVCEVTNHIPVCSCLEGYTGDPFSNCFIKPLRMPSTVALISFLTILSILAQEPVIIDLCSRSACGVNTVCNNGTCSCVSEYLGDPYTGCRPECVLSIECDRDKACIRNKCVDPCPGTCGQNAECKTINHIPTCTCAEGFSGNAFVSCSKQSMFFSTADFKL